MNTGWPLTAVELNGTIHRDYLFHLFNNALMHHSQRHRHIRILAYMCVIMSVGLFYLYCNTFYFNLW